MEERAEARLKGEHGIDGRARKGKVEGKAEEKGDWKDHGKRFEPVTFRPNLLITLFSDTHGRCHASP